MRRIMGGLTVLAALLVAGHAAPASALPLVSQVRTVSAEAELLDASLPVDSDAQADAAPGVGLFVSTASATALARVDDIAAADGFQDSELTLAGATLGVHAGGAALAFYDLVEAGADAAAAAAGSSILEIVFTTDVASDYALAGFIGACLEQRTVVSGSADTDVRAFLSLTGAATGVIRAAEVFDEVPIFGEFSRNLLFTGTLAPDTYTLRIGATSLAEGTDDSFASGLAAWGIDFTVAVPEPSTGLLVAVGLVFLARRRGARADPASRPR